MHLDLGKELYNTMSTIGIIKTKSRTIVRYRLEELLTAGLSVSRGSLTRHGGKKKR